MPKGILIHAGDRDALSVRRAFVEQACRLGMDQSVHASDEDCGVRFILPAEFQRAWAPEHDTLQLCARLEIDSLTSRDDLEREILLAMLLAPVTFEFPCYAEFAASVRMRINIVEAARNTKLSFDTQSIARPADCWTYAEDRGFTLRPGKPLIEALRRAIQPDVNDERYPFSCCRATEYVILLGIAQELEANNPALLKLLQRQWQTRAIMSREFHAVFLREYGSMSSPLPARFCVPGDRLWFRNPDENSSDVTGYEGSWVIYLGCGLFSNFWEPENPCTLDAKCIEIYHWRNAVRRSQDGNMQIDESVVEANIAATLSDVAERRRIVDKMLRMRDPRGVYADGGCIDTSRDYPRWVCTDFSDISLPDA